MTLLTDRRPLPPASPGGSPTDAPDGPGTGFRDCRGTWHRLDVDDDGGQG